VSPRSYGTGAYEPARGTSCAQVQATDVTIEMIDLQRVRDHFVWSVFNTVYMNICCLGLLALSYSVEIIINLSLNQNTLTLNQYLLLGTNQRLFQRRVLLSCGSAQLLYSKCMKG
uniref:Uncharacterized protein n=1 Tax=Xenopus tropicalis TaxID=8364 RepID=A0A6I8S6K6_XENTR